MSNKEKNILDANKLTANQLFFDKHFKNFRIIAAFLFPLVAFLAFRAQDILPFFLSKASHAVVLPFQIIIWGLILVYLNAMLLKIAFFMNKKGVTALSFALFIVYTAVLNSLLIPIYGLEGIATAALISVAVMFVFNLVYITKIGIKIPLYKSCEKPVIATMGMMLVLHYVDSWPFALVFLSAIASYALIFYILVILDK